MVAMKLQSETLPVLDGVPLKAYLKNLAENNKNLEVFQYEEEDSKENVEEEPIDPDKLTYEVFIYIIIRLSIKMKYFV